MTQKTISKAIDRRSKEICIENGLSIQCKTGRQIYYMAKGLLIEGRPWTESDFRAYRKKLYTSASHKSQA